MIKVSWHKILMNGGLILAIVLSIYLVTYMQKSLEAPSAVSHSTPDSFMEGVQAIRINKSGLLDSRLFSPKLVHYPQSNMTDISHPHLTIFNGKAAPWQIDALHGESQYGVDLIYLWDNVKIIELASMNNYETTLLTNALTLYPNRRFAETNEPVTMVQPGSQVEAVGMRVSIQEGWVKLLSNARGFYDAKAYEKPTK